MTPRPVVSLFLALVFSAPMAFAVEKGKAEGTVTINRKPVAMKYAFAKKEKTYDKKDRWVVVLTDRAVSRSLLDDDSRFHKAVENGDFVATVLQFDATKKLEQAEVRSKALQHKAIPMTTSKVKITPAFKADAIDGSAATTEEQEFFSDVVVMDVNFNAPLGQDKFGDNAAAAKELAASAPKIADGTASGTLKVDGKTVKLGYSVARTKPNAFDEKKKDVVVLLTSTAVPATTLADEDKLFAGVKDGSIRGLLVTIDSDEKPYHMSLLDPNAPIQLSGSGIFNFDATDYSEKHIAGKFYTTEEEDFMGGKHKYAYDVTFATPVQAIIAPSEVTVDSSSGTKLPADGGDPGKAYMAFDKAARTGNIAEMKKAASTSHPMPEMKPEEEKAMIEMIKAMRPAKIKVTGGFMSGDHATLNVEGQDPDSKAKVTGTIEMGRESGSWKLLMEKWKQ